ncbi:MAG TPA: glycerophosphodiester phosphodiesterase family protein [Clostridia bacterium]|nr:glycerophosphodiester phosphodiesterase family protein [Clostridia bacterium]
MFHRRFACVGLLLLLVSFFGAVGVGGAVLSIGHRGDSLHAPENTLAAFSSALGKADLVELDGQVSSDGYLVVMHDSTVDRTTDGTGSLGSKTLAQLKQLDAGSWFGASFTGERVPTLEESLATILPGATPLIERKAGSAAVYVNELRRLNAISNVVVQAFDWAFLAGVRALEPNIRLGALGSGNFTSTVLTNILNSGANMVAWEKSGVTPSMLSLVRSAGLQLFVWTVDGAEIKTFIDMGVDGIISNDPGLVRQIQQPATNAPVNIGNGLVAYWKLDDGYTHLFSVIVADSKGTNTAAFARPDGLSHWVTGGLSLFGGCVSVDGANGWITVPRTGTLDINTNAVTISAWVRLRDLPSQLSASFGAIYDSTNDCYVLYLDKSNKELRFKVTDAGGHAARPGIPESALTTNQWIHVAATYDGQFTPTSGQATIFLNGQPRDVHTGNDGTSPFGLTGRVKAGQTAGIGREGAAGGNGFSGHMDDVAIWNRALTPGEVARIYEKGLLGLSVADLTREATNAIVVKSARLSSSPGVLEIDFENLGSWQTFRLLRTADFGSDFIAVPGLTPVALGGGRYRFSYPITGAGVGWFRVEAQ